MEVAFPPMRARSNRESATQHPRRLRLRSIALEAPPQNIDVRFAVHDSTLGADYEPTQRGSRVSAALSGNAPLEPMTDVSRRLHVLTGVRCRSSGRCSPLTAWRLAAGGIAGQEVRSACKLANADSAT